MESSVMSYLPKNDPVITKQADEMNQMLRVFKQDKRALLKYVGRRRRENRNRSYYRRYDVQSMSQAEIYQKLPKVQKQ